MAEVEAMEGFICPICMTDLKTPTVLTKHFEEYHKDDPEILKSLKDLFGKAKKKILKQDEIQDYPDAVLTRIENKRQEIDWGPQEIGAIRSHTKYFKEVRNTRLERFATETNKLLIRLDKLLHNLPSDPVKRKFHEQAIVPWMDDKDVRLCLTCAKSFNLTRRKHHCRLCGVMMCHDCSLFLSLVEARKMTSPASVQEEGILSPTTESTTFADRLVQAGVGFSKFARSPSAGNLNNMLSRLSIGESANSDQFFRICQHCNNLLEARERLKARHFEKPVVHQWYEKLRAQMQDGDRLLDVYYKMWNSLNEGESTYNLHDAQTLRGRIAKIADNVNLLSKKIAALVKVDENSSAALREEARLHQMIQSAAVSYLREIYRTPPVPTEEEFEAIKSERQERIRARIAYERQLEEERQEKLRESQRQMSQRPANWGESPTSNQVVLDQSQGWGTSTSRPGGNKMITTATIDPFVEQMSNLRLYIKQAREECKFEEVATLERNLKELQSAYFAMQQQESNNVAAVESND